MDFELFFLKHTCKHHSPSQQNLCILVRYGAFCAEVYRLGFLHDDTTWRNVEELLNALFSISPQRLIDRLESNTRFKFARYIRAEAEMNADADADAGASAGVDADNEVEGHSRSDCDQDAGNESDWSEESNEDNCEHENCGLEGFRDDIARCLSTFADPVNVLGDLTHHFDARGTAIEHVWGSQLGIGKGRHAFHAQDMHQVLIAPALKKEPQDQSEDMPQRQSQDTQEEQAQNTPRRRLRSGAQHQTQNTLQKRKSSQLNSSIGSNSSRPKRVRLTVDYAGAEGEETDLDASETDFEPSEDDCPMPSEEHDMDDDTARQYRFQTAIAGS